VKKLAINKIRNRTKNTLAMIASAPARTANPNAAARIAMIRKIRE